MTIYRQHHLEPTWDERVEATRRREFIERMERKLALKQALHDAEATIRSSK